MSASTVTSHGSTNVAPIDSASGRTRFSIRLSTEENPTSAPCAWSARAIPHAIEWSLATPKIRAVLPSSNPIVPSLACAVRCYAPIMPDRRPRPTDLRAALDGVAGFVLDADGVLILKGRPIPGALDALRRLEARGTPFRVVTNFSLAHRATLAQRFAEADGLILDPDRIITASSAAAVHTAATYPGRPLFVLAAPDALREFDGQHLLTPDEAKVAPAGAVAAVVLGDAGDELSYRNMAIAFRLIRDGADFLAMHRNPWWYTPEGVVLDAGAFVVGLEYSIGRRALVLGKPSPVVFRQALDGTRADLGRRVRRGRCGDGR